MDITKLLTPERVLCLQDISSKKRVLEKLSELLCQGASDFETADVFNRLIERERLGSTGLGHGVALPHGRMGDNEITIGAFIKLDEGVDFDSPDHQAADLLFALLVPEQHTSEHCPWLACSAILNSVIAYVCAKLTKSSTTRSVEEFRPIKHPPPDTDILLSI